MDEARMEAGLRAASRKATRLLRPLHILLVDADSTYRAALAAKLSKDGHIVSSFSNCHDAWIMAQQVSFDLTLLDIEVPAMTSLELVRRIRRKDKAARIIATSPNVTQRSARAFQLCEANGIEQVYGKDVGLNQLYNRLAVAMQA
jgi:CheY-like chemotaxis protein